MFLKKIMEELYKKIIMEELYVKLCEEILKEFDETDKRGREIIGYLCEDILRGCDEIARIARKIKVETKWEEIKRLCEELLKEMKAQIEKEVKVFNFSFRNLSKTAQQNLS